MPTYYVSCVSDFWLSAGRAWAMSHGKRFKPIYNIMGCAYAYFDAQNTCKIQSKFMNIGLSSFVIRKDVGNEIMLGLWTIISKYVVSRCVLDEQKLSTFSSSVASLKCVNNHFEFLGSFIHQLIIHYIYIMQLIIHCITHYGSTVYLGMTRVVSGQFQYFENKRCNAMAKCDHKGPKEHHSSTMDNRAQKRSIIHGSTKGELGYTLIPTMYC